MYPFFLDPKVFILYTLLQSKPSVDNRGLGFYNAKQDVLELSVSIPGRKRELDIELAQDTTSLRSRKGDTGSVLWRTGLDFGVALLHDLDSIIVSREDLRDAVVLELGYDNFFFGVFLPALIIVHVVQEQAFFQPCSVRSANPILLQTFLSWSR